MSATVGKYETGVREEAEAARVRAKGGLGGDGLSLVPSAARMQSLDAFRGMTVAGMILVNNPGTWSAIYSPLEHAEWHGWTPTDLVFPFFLFIVGVAIPLAFARRMEEGGNNRDLYLKIIRRSIIIFALGLFLAAFPHFNFATLRI